MSSRRSYIQPMVIQGAGLFLYEANEFHIFHPTNLNLQMTIFILLYHYHIKMSIIFLGE